MVPLPSVGPDHRWPASRWENNTAPDAIDHLLDEAFDQNPHPVLDLSLAVVVIHHGRLVAERYGPETDADTTLISWSTAKSITHAMVGLASSDGLIDLDAPVAAPEWHDAGDPRRAITLRHLLAMRSGLEFNEDYVDSTASHCLEMLFGQGASDMAHYAASLPAIAPPDTVFNYSSGTTNLLSRATGHALGRDADGVRRYLRERLFGPLGMNTAQPRFDSAGTFVGSSYVYATARDFARFGELYLRDGMWDGQRLLPEGWVDLARTPISLDAETGYGYGHHWWVEADDLGTFGARGYEGQRITCVPALDLVVVRLGKTPIGHREHLDVWMRRLIDCFR